MTKYEALSLARNMKFGPLPKPQDPFPDIKEAIDIIREERRTCGFNWLTGQAAEEVLLTESRKKHRGNRTRRKNKERKVII